MSASVSGSKRPRAEDGAVVPSTIVPCSFRGHPAVVLKNDHLMVTILTGRRHIASMISPFGPQSAGTALPTIDPSLRRLSVQGNIAEPGDKEGELLAGIGGINLCLDVFGQHSAGEVGEWLCFHGEAGLVTWEVDSWKDGTLTLTAELTRTMLRCTRSYRLEGPELHVTEKLKNLASFERVLGRCQHVTFGDQFLTGAECQFEALCDKGMTWPTDMDPSGALNSQWQPGTVFDYPDIRGGHVPLPVAKAQHPPPPPPRPTAGRPSSAGRCEEQRPRDDARRPGLHHRVVHCEPQGRGAGRGRAPTAARPE